MEYPNYGSTQHSRTAIKVLKCKHPERLPLCATRTREYQGPTLLGICRTNFLFGAFLLTYLMFLLSGAAIFSMLEAPEEQALRTKLNSAIRKFRTAYPGVTDADLETLIDEVVSASNRGVLATGNVTGVPNWSFGQSLFFSSTVVTTIGYGHVTPLSRTGKAFCIVYAVIGIPLTLVLLSALVERLLIPTVWLLQWLNSHLGHLYQPFNIRLFHLLIIVFILVSVFLLAPAAVFSYIEPDWNYLDSFYYCFISLTTIGLGDYIPGDSPNQPYRPIYKIATTGYLFLGITFMMLTLAVFYDIPQLNLGLLFTNEDASSEKVHLTSAGIGLQYGAGGAFSPHCDDNTHRHVVRVRSRPGDDSPSPEESSTMKDFKDLRVP